jgi:hypothetical protein
MLGFLDSFNLRNHYGSTGVQGEAYGGVVVAGNTK